MTPKPKPRPSRRSPEPRARRVRGRGLDDRAAACRHRLAPAALRASCWSAGRALAFVEVHSENFFADGGAALACCTQAREHSPVSLHGVGLALGSAAGLDPWHLDRLAALVRAHRAACASATTPASRARRGAAASQPVHGNDLLPIAFTDAALRHHGRQRAAGAGAAGAADRWSRTCRPTCTGPTTRIAEPEFFNELARRSGCGLLLDVNNLVVNALNDAGDDDARCAAACRWVDAIDPAIVGEIHLAGYDDSGDARHRRPRQPRARAGVAGVPPRRAAAGRRVPTLVEWDTDAAGARRAARRSRGGRGACCRVRASAGMNAARQRESAAPADAAARAVARRAARRRQPAGCASSAPDGATSAAWRPTAPTPARWPNARWRRRFPTCSS